MGFNHLPNCHEIEIADLVTKNFLDARGHGFEVTFDSTNGSVIELICTSADQTVLTIVKRQPEFEDQWLGKMVSNEALGKPHIQAPVESIPNLTRYLCDARYDDERGELTLASQKRTKRWIIRRNGAGDYYSSSGHQRLQ
jgi:hypothetical protein